ncbi:MAG: Peroxiredoxin [Chthonomonadaceae bacterium]|nr:Peroxiredoxin [Chthonomonadaceae bacterium]
MLLSASPWKPLLFLTACLALTPPPVQAQDAPKSPLSSLTWSDLSGHTWKATDVQKKKATVFFFGSAECPISNIYTPRMVELAKTYTSQGVGFFLVDANREDSAAALRKYAAERGVGFPVVKDDKLELADGLIADHTPEAIVVDGQGTVRYRGRIDDNRDRTKIIRHDLQEALDALLAGKPVARPRTLAVGCSIFRDRPATEMVSASGMVDYAHDVAPILYGNCVVCHRSGEAAPFALETYQQAKTWAGQIKDYTSRRQMPPSKAVKGYGEFCDQRVLDDKQIATLAKWAVSGAPAGNLKTAPALPKFAPPNDWTLGKPDVVMQPDRPYHLAAEGDDVYREFVMPQVYDEDKFITSLEFQPENRAVVHHIVLYFDPTGKSASMDGKEKEPGYSVSGAGIGVFGEQFVQAWVPGGTPYTLPKGTAYRLKKGCRIVIQVHYHKDGKVEQDRSRVSVRFASPGEVEKELRTAALINPIFQLKPGDAHQEVKCGLTLPVNATIWSVFPHMHLLGREMKITATLPNGGGEKPLVWVNDWDFNWQETYRYKQPVSLPKGTHINLVATYDNSERNPRQPTHPPAFVRWGEQTTDEMCIGFLQYTIDLEKLAAK